jgi:EpsI family protein
LISAVLLLVVAVFSLSQLPDRTEITPSRLPLKQFPTSFSDWRGHRDKLSTEVLDVLKLDDYLMADFVASGQGLPINFYVAYYNSQRKGESAHSPRACLPGGGWRIDEQGVKEIPEIVVAGRPLKVNRMLIKLGDNQSLVYYWFQQRGRVITSEYMVKWYLFWDSLTRKRTDGALVRLVVPVNGADGVDRAEHEMITLLSPIVAELPRYIPD